MPSKVGDICLCCKERWEKKGKKLLKLIELPKLKPESAVIAVCTYCDAPVIETAEATIERHAT